MIPILLGFSYGAVAVLIVFEMRESGRFSWPWAIFFGIAWPLVSLSAIIRLLVKGWVKR